MELKYNPYLIQRLEIGNNVDKVSPQDVKNWNGFESPNVKGWSKESKVPLNEWLSFDYMGASEFEFGAIPKSLKKFHEKAELAVLEIPLRALTPEELTDLAESAKSRYKYDIRKSYIKNDPASKKEKKDILNNALLTLKEREKSSTIPVYIVMGAEHEDSHRNKSAFTIDDIKTTLNVLANNHEHSFYKETRLNSKEMIKLHDSLLDMEGFNRKYKGWLDLDNNITWFTDKKMAQLFANMVNAKNKEALD